jgi:shikimate 5-dehydrogenase
VVCPRRHKFAPALGLNVTIPFKEDAFRYCAKLSPRAPRQVQ